MNDCRTRKSTVFVITHWSTSNGSSNQIKLIQNDKPVLVCTTRGTIKQKWRCTKLTFFACATPNLTSYYSHNPQNVCSLATVHCRPWAKLPSHGYSKNSSYSAMPMFMTFTTMQCESNLSSKARISCVELTLSFHNSHKLSRYFSL